LATGYTPFELVYEHLAEIPTTLTKPPKPTYNYEDYAQELKEKIRATNQIAKKNVREEKRKSKGYYDKKIIKTIFKISDRVLIFEKHDGTCKPSKTIYRTIKGTHQIQTTKKPQEFRKTAKYSSPNAHRQQIPGTKPKPASMFLYHPHQG